MSDEDGLPDDGYEPPPGPPPLTPEEQAALELEATRLYELYNLGNKVSACRELALDPRRALLFPLVKAGIPAPEHNNFTRLYNTFVNRPPQP